MSRTRVLVWLRIAASLLATIVLFAFVVALSYDLIHGNRVDRADIPSSLEPVRIAGSEQTVFSWPRDRCALRDYRDLPARAFRDAGGDVQLIASRYRNRRFIGPSLDRLTHPCDVTMASARNANPARFDDLEWLGSPYTQDGRTVYALVHNEYKGHQHPGRCPSADYLSCWYNSVTLAVSRATAGHRSTMRDHPRGTSSRPSRTSTFPMRGRTASSTRATSCGARRMRTTTR